MYKQIDVIFKSDLKPKQRISAISEIIIKQPEIIPQIITCFETSNKAEKGDCMEALEYTSKDHPELILPYISFVVNQINHDLPRVRWEASRIVANLARDAPTETRAAIPKLLANTTDSGTVVRWSAAYALTEIAQSQANSDEFITVFHGILQSEKNSGVSRLYVNALRKLEG